MAFSDRLKFLRKQHKITQEQLAKIINVERSSIGKYESSNTIPSIETLIKISKYFNISIDYLLENNVNDTKTLVKNDLSEQEKTLLETFRNTTEFGRQRIIQSALNVYDEIEKKNTGRNTKTSS